MSETQDEEDIKPKEKLNIKEESDHATGETTEEEDNYPEIGEVKREINISDFIRKEVKKEPVTESDEADKMEVMNSDAALDLKVTVKEEVDKTELIKAEMDEDTEDTVNGGEDMTELLEKKEIKMEVKEEVKEKDEGEDGDSEKTEIEEKDDTSVIKDEEDEVKIFTIWAVEWDFQQFDILTSIDSDEPLQPSFLKLRNSKLSSVSSLTVIKYSSDKQRLWSGWSEPLLVAHTTLLEISCIGSFLTH